MISHLIIDYLFVFSVIVIWFMLLYQFILFLLGYLYGFRAERQRRRLEATQLDLPAISIMVPAHNEAMVITETLNSLLKLTYPKDRLEILVVNDGSTDDTAARVEAIAAATAGYGCTTCRSNLRHAANRRR